MALPEPICQAHTPEWRVQRSNYVTGSALATLMGMNKYKNIDVLRKEYLLERSSSNLEWKRAVWYGVHLEEANLGILNFMLNPQAHVWANHGFYVQGSIGATLDGVGTCLKADGKMLGLERSSTFSSAYKRLETELYALEFRHAVGHQFVVELKNSDLPKSDWGKQPPAHYWCQVQAQLWATGLDWGLLVAKVGAADMRIYVIEKDEIWLEEANERAEEFMADIRKEREKDND